MERVLPLLVMILLSACAGPSPLPLSEKADTRPEWIDAIPQEPGALYSVASVKLSDSQPQSEQQAKQLAVKQLKQQLRITLPSSYPSPKNTFSDLEREIHRRAPTINLSFIEPVASYCDEGAGRVYALARLDVAKEVALAGEKAEGLNHSIEQHAVSLQSSDGQVLQKLQESTKALLALERRRQLHLWVKNLQPAGEGLPLTPRLLDVQQRVLQGVAQTPISISPLSGYGVDITISQVLSQQLLQRGLVVSELGQLQLQYSLQQQNRYHDDNFFVTIDGVIQLSDRQDRRLMSLKVVGEGSDVREIEAIRQALAVLGEQAAVEVIEVLFAAD